MMRLEPASPVSQRRWDFTKKRVVHGQVQKFVRARYRIDPATTKPVATRKRGLWGTLAQLFGRGQ